jgi:hypothetical protein
LIVSGLPLVSSGQGIQSTHAVTYARAAPGEDIPVQVRLSNFGSESRADVTVEFSVLDDAGRSVAAESQSLAVETSLSFIHPLSLPPAVPAGEYTVRVSVIYPGQEAPAVSSYQLTVEQKIAGIFLSDFLRYVLVAAVSVMVVLGSAWMFERYHHRRDAAHDYTEVPQAIRVYYEIVADIIREMRLHEGDAALQVAAEVKGLHVNDAGVVTSIEGSPGVVVSALVSAYEEKFKKRINLCFEKDGRCKALVDERS